MDAAYKVSKQLVKERMKGDNPEDVEILDSITESDIVCMLEELILKNSIFQAVQRLRKLLWGILKYVTMYD